MTTDTMNTNDDTEPLAHSFFGQPMTRDDRLPVIQAELIKRLETERDMLVAALNWFAGQYHQSQNTGTWHSVRTHLYYGNTDEIQRAFKAAADVMAAIRGKP